MKTKITIGIIVGAAIIGILGYMRIKQNAPPAATETKKLHVLATFFPLYDFAREIGNDRIELDMLFPQTPETASFSPADIEKVRKADIVIKNGAGLEPVLDDLLAASDNKNTAVIDASNGIELLKENGEANPHVWLDPLRAIQQAETIRDALRAHDPANADIYAANAERYVTRLRALDEEISKKTARFPKNGFIAFHPAFVYFANRYGLRQVAAVEEFPGKEPSPREIARTIQTIKDLKINAIFAEPQFSPRIVETIARDTGIQVRTLDPMETGDPEKDSYLSIMEKNAAALEEALK